MPLTTAWVANARSRSAGSKPSIRFQSARYGDAGSWAWMATTRRTAAGTSSGARSSSSWRARVARFSARADRGIHEWCRPARPRVHRLDLGHAHRSSPYRLAPARRLPRRRGLRVGLLRPRRGDDGHPRRAGGRHAGSGTSRPATSRARRSWPTSTAGSPAGRRSRWRRSARARRTSSRASRTRSSTARRWSRSPARRARTSSTRSRTSSSTSRGCSSRSRSGRRGSGAPDAIPETVARAFRTARLEKPGPDPHRAARGHRRHRASTRRSCR